MKGVKLDRDLVDAKTGKSFAEAGKKLSAPGGENSHEAGLKQLLIIR